MSDLNTLPKPIFELSPEAYEYYKKIGQLLIDKRIWENIFSSQLEMYSLEIAHYFRLVKEFEKTKNKTLYKEMIFVKIQSLQDFKKSFLISDREAVYLDIPFGMELIKTKKK